MQIRVGACQILNSPEPDKSASKALTWMVRGGGCSPSDLTHTMMVLGEAYAQCGQHEQAFDVFSKVAGIQPEWPVPFSAMGDAWAQAGKTAEAIEAYDHALELDDQWEPAWCGLGGVLTESGDHGAAREAFDKAILANPTFPAAHLGLGRLHAAMGQADEATASFKTADELDPHGPVGDEARALLDGPTPQRLVDDVSEEG